MRIIRKTTFLLLLLIVFEMSMVLIIGCEKKEAPNGFGFTIHKVSSFDDWMFGFEKGIDVRTNGGVISSQIFQSVNDSNLIAVLTECASMEALKKFLDSPDLKEAMKKGAVVGKPDFYFLEQAGKGSVVDQGSLGSKLYSVTILNLKEFTKWKVDFDANVEMRKEAGQGAFRIFRNAENPNQIALFIEWENLEKAENFLGSDELKEANTRSGVTEMIISYFFNEVKTETVTDHGM